MIEVLAVGPGATVQDLGRPGFARSGVGRSGAADLGALALGNRLVGNAETAAALEFTFGGAHLRVTTPTVVALTGAPTALVTDAPRAGWAIAFTLRAGDTLTLGPPDHGVRSYLAVAGGIAVPEVLGSRSTDTLAGLGPPPLAAGDRLPIGPTSHRRAFATLDASVARAEPLGEHLVAAVDGPRSDWAQPDALFSRPFRVRSDSDRVGVRLDGDPILRRPGELASEGMVRGAVQLPPDGRPIVLGPDHPVTGGYPVIAVVVGPDLDRLGQLRPGDVVRFRRAPDVLPLRP